MRFWRKREPKPKVMTDEEARRFIRQTHRAEAEDNTWCYTKAIRASLEALGYDHHWIEGPFRDMLERSYFGTTDVCGEVTFGADG